MGLLCDHDRVVASCDSISIDFIFLHLLEALQTEHGAPEDESDDQVEKYHNYTDQLLAHLHIVTAKINRRGCALGENHELPV